METILLQTKLFIPPFRQSHILRPRLVEKLSGSEPYKLILLSAPAGYGKTTLVAEWINDFQLGSQESGQNQKSQTPSAKICWLSLDEDDNDTQRFFGYLAAAVQPLGGQNRTLPQLLQAPQLPSAKHLMGAFVNDLTAVDAPFYLILDDYHVIDLAAIDEAISFLLDYAPPQMTLIITSRTDPGFPISRLRARGQLLEIRASDLRFTQEETAAFLHQTMNLTLTPDQIAALESRTEGWIAGLQMAALSMQNRDDLAGFIAGFTGSHRFIMDYLLEEVLNQQPAEVQAFLLETALLDRFCAELCDAVRGATNSQDILHQLDSENLFLIQLDNERRWYRYHHLFAEILQQRLHQQRNSLAIADLHGRASQWCEDNGLDIEAFQYATVAGDVDRAEQLITGNGVPLYLRGAGTPVLNWLASLPTELLNQRASLLVSYASALVYVGKAPEAESCLQKAEALLKNSSLDDQLRDLLGQTAALRAMMAISYNDFETIITYSKQALSYLHPDNQTLRTTTTWTMGFAYHIQGNLEAARQIYEEVVAVSQASGNQIFYMGAMIGLGQIQEATNELALAAENYQKVLQAGGDSLPPPICEAYRGLANIYYQWNQLEQAKRYAQDGYELALRIENIGTPATCQQLLARVALVQGDTAVANQLLSSAEQFLQAHQFTHELPEQAALQTYIYLRQNRLAEAAELANRYDLPLSQARVYLAQGQPMAALSRLAPYRQEMAENGRADKVLEAILLQALAHQANGDGDTAVEHLDEALQMAEPHQFIRIFVDEGQPMAQLLTAVVQSEYVTTLRAAFPTTMQTPQPLVDPLSERELEILTHIASGLKNKEIAAELFVSINTVHYHTKNIYGKLGVNNRAQAIAKAQALELI